MENLINDDLEKSLSDESDDESDNDETEYTLTAVYFLRDHW